MSPFLNLEILCDNPDAAKLRDMNITTVNSEESPFDHLGACLPDF